MNISDDMLMAYADGELDAAQCAQIEQAVALDARLAARLAQHQALRKKVQGAFAPVLAAPVPEHLLAALRKPSAQTAGESGFSNVIAFKTRQVNELQATQRRAQWSWPQWSAMAASLIVGVLGTLVVLNNKSNDMITARTGALLATGRLATALTAQLSGATNDQIQMKLSFKARSGEYCRSFVIKQQQSMAGLACRNGAEWRVPVLTATTGSDGTYRQAGSELPPAVLQWIDAERDGDALDAEGEQAARKAEWKK